MNQPQTDYSGEEENDIDRAYDLPARLDPLSRVLGDLVESEEIDGWMMTYEPPKFTNHVMIEFARKHNEKTASKHGQLDEKEDKFVMILVYPKSPA